MWLYHYSPGPLPDACAEGFLGFVRRGQSFDLATSSMQPDETQRAETKEAAATLRQLFRGAGSL